MKQIFKILLDFLLPPTCPVCHKRVAENLTICSKCFAQLEFIGNRKCSVCGKPLDVIVPGMAVCGECLKKAPHFRHAEAVFKYNDISKKLILAFKHSDHIELTRLMTKWMSQACGNVIENNQILIPVPLHWSRLFKRKYNQSALLAQELAKQYHKVYNPLILLRNKYTKSQGHLSQKERQKNVTGVFEVKRSQLIKGKSILLIDDVFTTGATANECARVLLKAGAKSVDVLTFARVVRE